MGRIEYRSPVNQTDSAGGISVCLKSSSLNSNFPPVALAAAYAKQSPMFNPSRCRPFRIAGMPQRHFSLLRRYRHDVGGDQVESPFQAPSPGHAFPCHDHYQRHKPFWS